MAFSHPHHLFDSRMLPDGSKEIVLRRRGTRHELIGYGVAIGVLFAAAAWLRYDGRGTESDFSAAIGVLMLILLLRERLRVETWTLHGRDARRVLKRFGISRRLELRDVERVVVTKQSDSDDRDLRRICLQKDGKSTRVGPDYQNDPRAAFLARTLAETLGVPLELPSEKK